MKPCVNQQAKCGLRGYLYKNGADEYYCTRPIDDPVCYGILVNYDIPAETQVICTINTNQITCPKCGSVFTEVKP